MTHTTYKSVARRDAAVRRILCVLCLSSAISGAPGRAAAQGTEIRTYNAASVDTPRLRIESGADTAEAYIQNANFGIGTATPGGKLHIASGAGAEFLVDNASEWQAKDSGGTAQGFLWPRWTDNITYLNFGVGGFNIRNNASSSKVFIQDGGNVGIGTTTPTRLLDTTGNAKLNNVFIGDVGHGATWAGFSHDSIPGTGTYGLLQSSDSNYTLLNKASGAGWIGFRVNNADMMVVRETGNVGIGTTTAPSPLTVAGSAYVATAMSSAGTVSIKDAAPQINFDDTDHNDWAIHVNSNKMYFIREPWNFSDLVLDGAGNIGIGDASPADKLCVHGSLRMNDSQIYFRGHGDNNHGISYQAGPPDGLQVYGWDGITIEDRNGGTTMLANFDTGGIRVGSNRVESNTGTTGSVRLKDADDGLVYFDYIAGSGGSDLRVYITSPSTSKDFVIAHPTDGRKYLIHSCLEGPEDAVFYRGTGRLKEGRAEIVLPAYFEALTREAGRSVQVTPEFDDEEPVSALAAAPVRGGRFAVRALDGANPVQAFSWEVKAVRKDVPPVLVEPDRDEVEVRGIGPYRYYREKRWSLYPE